MPTSITLLLIATNSNSLLLIRSNVVSEIHRIDIRQSSTFSWNPWKCPTGLRLRPWSWWHPHFQSFSSLNECWYYRGNSTSEHSGLVKLCFSRHLWIMHSLQGPAASIWGCRIPHTLLYLQSAFRIPSNTHLFIKLRRFREEPPDHMQQE